MRKFKHKKTGNIAENRGDIYFFPHSWGSSHLPKDFIENTEDWEEVSKQKLFTSEDGSEIFEGDTVWHTNLNTNMKPYSTIVKYTEPFTPVRGLFSTKEKAEEHILMNKPCLSINDIKNVGNGRTAYDIVADSLIELVKSKL